jgi:multidrug efflux pump
MVLAIGIVVDDAIIVLENIHRHIEDGMEPTDAAIRGARELAWPVVAMTTTLVAVYLPIGFLGGLTGTLFVEFAFSLAGAVLLSGIIALTLSPMMCAKLLKVHPHGQGKTGIEAWLDEKFTILQNSYQNKLHSALDEKHVILVFGGIVLVSCYFLFVSTPNELEPQEDQGFVLAIAQGDPGMTLDYLETYTRQMDTIAEELPEVENLFLLNGIGGAGAATNSAFAGFVLNSWNERDRNTVSVQQAIDQKLSQIAGIQLFSFVPPSLPSAGGGPPVQFIIGSTESAENLIELSDEILMRAYQSRKFIFIDKDLKIDKPRMDVLIDREKAATLGISMQQIGMELGAMLSGGFANRFALENRSYKVIPQVQRSDRLTASQLEQYYIRTGAGELIPLSTIVSLREMVEPQQLKRFQQLNAVAITFAPRPGVSKGEALRILDEAAADILPQGYSVDYAGESRQFKQEGSAMLLTLALALIVIFLVLSAQFESFRDALIMLLTVPMAICGALLTLNVLAIVSGILGFQGIEAFPGMSINIYTQVGLVTLVGVISKHGILIVEFANKLQINEGMSKREAIEEATAIRLRPVLMTTAALVFAMIPLLIASGPGAAARFSMGVVIASGMAIGTMFTLFVLPAFYLYLARDHAHDREKAAQAEAEGGQLPPPEPQHG